MNKEIKKDKLIFNYNYTLKIILACTGMYVPVSNLMYLNVKLKVQNFKEKKILSVIKINFSITNKLKYALQNTKEFLV